MSEFDKNAVFPDIVPDSAIGTRLWVHENDDFSEEEAISGLLKRLYDYPEDEFYLYVLKDQPISQSLHAALNNGYVIITESKGYYYPHPKFKRYYVCLTENCTRWAWERDVLKQGHMHFQHTLKLSEKARRTFEMQELVAMHQEANSDPLILQPNFAGIGIDLKKAFTWLLQRIKSKSRVFE